MSNILQETIESLMHDFDVAKDPWLKSLEEAIAEAAQDEAEIVEDIKEVIEGEKEADEKVEEITEIIADIKEDMEEEKEEEVEAAVETTEAYAAICLYRLKAQWTNENLDENEDYKKACESFGEKTIKSLSSGLLHIRDKWFSTKVKAKIDGALKKIQSSDYDKAGLEQRISEKSINVNIRAEATSTVTPQLIKNIADSINKSIVSTTSQKNLFVSSFKEVNKEYKFSGTIKEAMEKSCKISDPVKYLQTFNDVQLNYKLLQGLVQRIAGAATGKIVDVTANKAMGSKADFDKALHEVFSGNGNRKEWEKHLLKNDLKEKAASAMGSAANFTLTQGHQLVNKYYDLRNVIVQGMRICDAIANQV